MGAVDAPYCPTLGQVGITSDLLTYPHREICNSRAAHHRNAVKMAAFLNLFSWKHKAAVTLL
jgi:hypothetical protein